MITASIVLYNDTYSELAKTVDSFLATPLDKKLYLIDNSPTNRLMQHFIHKDIEYIFNSDNRGFGAGHNKILSKIKANSDFHLVLNPDVLFEPAVIPNLLSVFNEDATLALVGPKVRYKNGEHQYTCRRFPSILELIARRLGPLKKLFASLIKKGTYRDFDLNNAFYPEALQGCFLLFRTVDFVHLNGFDERYFMYMEDIDICRSLDRTDKRIMYFPNEEVIHVFKRESSKNVRLFFVHLRSAFRYFKKWGI